MVVILHALLAFINIAEFTIAKGTRAIPAKLYFAVVAEEPILA